MAGKYYIPLLPDKTYHLFNRAIGNEKLFLAATNYRYFFSKFMTHTSAIADIPCYCLLPNHFHFLMRIKSTDEVAAHYEKMKETTPDLRKPDSLSDFLMERISNCLNGYTKAFNIMYNRKGGLFMDYTRRSEIDSDEFLTKIVHYIHANPVHHGYCEEIGFWRYSSYHSFLNKNNFTNLQKEILDWFGGKARFIDFHKQPIELHHPCIISDY